MFVGQSRQCVKKDNLFLVRVVLDTNVLISALLWPHSSPARVVILARHRKILHITSSYILEEFRRVLIQKFGFEAQVVENAVRILLDDAEIIEPSHRLNVVASDPKDNPILECAVSGKARWVVTDDKDLLIIGSIRGIDIVSPREFLSKTSES